MKKIIYILFAIFTFSIGFWFFQMRPLIKTITLCEISGNVELYRSKHIRIKAYLDNVGEDKTDLDYSVSDYRNGCLTGASLVISDKLKEQLDNDGNLKALINDLRQKNNELNKNREGKGLYVLEVEIIGEIEKQPDSDYGVLVAPPPFIIKADKIEPISAIRYVNREEAIKSIDSK
ncbi:MAG: hypothetical protein WA584_01215 [Pyrinomonadaceae bacterium]